MVALLLYFRLYPCLDASRPENVGGSIAQETIQTLHTLVVQFMRDHATQTRLCTVCRPYDRNSPLHQMCGPHWEVYDSIVATMHTVYTFCCLSISYIIEPVRLIIFSLMMLVAKLSFLAVSHHDLASVRVAHGCGYGSQFSTLACKLYL